MQKRNYLSGVFTLLLAVSIITLNGCKKQAEGFISDRIFYPENPFTVPQGATVVSSSLEGDGSTAPLYVSLLGFKDSAGNNVDTAFTKPQTITTYSGAITFADSTVALLRAKLHDSLVQPFNIAEKGGRMQFTAGTVFVNPGTYTMDVAVRNVRGTRVLQNACVINIVPASAFVSFDRNPYSYTADTLTGARQYSDDNPNVLSPVVTIKRDAAGPAVITFKFVDADGNIFNPAAGELIPRPGLANFTNWDPYYPLVTTDTSLAYQYPDHVPNFPAFSTSASGAVNYTCYYRIPAKYLSDKSAAGNGVEGRIYFAANFPNAVGSYNITFRFRQFHKKQ